MSRIYETINFGYLSWMCTQGCVLGDVVLGDLYSGKSRKQPLDVDYSLLMRDLGKSHGLIEQHYLQMYDYNVPIACSMYITESQHCMIIPTYRCNRHIS